MQIEYTDKKINTVSIKTLNAGDTFMIPGDDLGCVYMNVGLYNDYGRYHFITLGEFSDVDSTNDGDFQVRQVTSKLIVEI